MDALVATIAQILDYVLTQGPDAIMQLTALLTALKAGVGSVALLCDLVAQVPAITATLPAVTEIISQLIALISSGAGITEIATVLGQLATSLGLSIETIVHVLQMVGALLVAF
ncbi:MAG TPA: hypothetical protein DD001_16175 [Microcoleaceae bacterium UBA10368]|jgi:hypothetical protein|nr:hypothetical protein [Microcoleaceae cyanobacterium UBA10368]HCV29443.1 hypothetical protein [Microcoleaceae cyanobacterium UBA9251]